MGIQGRKRKTKANLEKTGSQDPRIEQGWAGPKAEVQGTCRWYGQRAGHRAARRVATSPGSGENSRELSLSWIPQQASLTTSSGLSWAGLIKGIWAGLGWATCGLSGQSYLKGDEVSSVHLGQPGQSGLSLALLACDGLSELDGLKWARLG